MRKYLLISSVMSMKNVGPKLSSDVSRLTKKYDNFKLT